MLLTQPVCDQVSLTIYTKGRKHCLKEILIEEKEIRVGDLVDQLNATYEATVASEKWRDYVNHKSTFEKHIDSIVP